MTIASIPVSFQSQKVMRKRRQSLVADAILEGRANAMNDVVDTVKGVSDEFVEVSEQA